MPKLREGEHVERDVLQVEVDEHRCEDLPVRPGEEERASLPQEQQEARCHRPPAGGRPARSLR